MHQLADADRHVEILRLAIYLERDAQEISDAAGQLEHTLQTAHVQISGGRADGWTKNAVSVALRTAGLVSALLEP